MNARIKSQIQLLLKESWEKETRKIELEFKKLAKHMNSEFDKLQGETKTLKNHVNSLNIRIGELETYKHEG